MPSPTPALRIISSPPSDSRTSSICSEFSGKYLLVPIEIIKPLKGSEGCERAIDSDLTAASLSRNSARRRLSSINKAASFNCETCGNFLPIVQIEESVEPGAEGLSGSRRRVSINRAMSLNAAPSVLRLTSGDHEDFSGSFPADQRPSPNHLHPAFSSQNRQRLSRVVRAASLNAGNISPTGTTPSFLPVMHLIDRPNVMTSTLKSRSAKLLLLHRASSSTDSNSKVEKFAPGAPNSRISPRESMDRQLSTTSDDRKCFINRAASWNCGISLRALREELDKRREELSREGEPMRESDKNNNDNNNNNKSDNAALVAATRRKLSFLKASSAQVLEYFMLMKNSYLLLNDDNDVMLIR